MANYLFANFTLRHKLCTLSIISLENLSYFIFYLLCCINHLMKGFFLWNNNPVLAYITIRFCLFDLRFHFTRSIAKSVAYMCAHFLSCVWLLETTWIVASKVPLSMGFPRQEYRSGLPFPLQEIFPTQGSNPCFLSLLHWEADSLLLCHLESPCKSVG